MNIATPKFGVGASALRKEDLSFIKGEGRYTSDIFAEGELRGYVVRSPIAVGSFTITSVEDAKSAPGVHLVLTAKDLTNLGPVACLVRAAQPDGTPHEFRHIPVLCENEVRYVGDAVAFIVADTLVQAQDAAELIEIDWDMGEAAVNTATALEAETPLVWPELGTNKAFVNHTGDKAATDAAFAAAAHVTEIEFINNRLICNYMETRAVLAEWDPADESFTVTTGSQGVHGVRDTLAKDVFKMPAEKVRVITPDVGGGFGTKAFNYRENPLAMEAARRLGRPVKWVCDRTEHMLTDAHGRDNVVKASMALDKDGKFTGLRIDLIANMGGYLSQFAPFIPTLGASMATGLYDIQNLDMTITAVYTHTTPVDAYRGAGRPEAAYLIERLVDSCARELGMPVEELRRRNFIPPSAFPYKTPAGRVYDVGEFDAHMSLAMERAGWSAIEERNSTAKQAGKIRGIGMATYIEACAFAGSEPVHLQLNEDGTITLFIGTQSNGQGHITAYSQFVADKIGIDFEQIIVRQGDTNELATGGGTGGSRSVPLGGVSAAKASETLAEKMKKIAADELEASTGDIELVDGKAQIVGTDRVMTYADIAQAAPSPEDVYAMADVHQDEATYPNGTHICEVEIDLATGTTDVIAYTIVDDFGMTVNPILLAGQVHGGVVQGIGQCLTEGTVYSEDGQLLTATFMDYAMPRAGDVPNFSFETRNVPSITNALGIKGAGEAGTIGACPAVMNAIIDAMDREFGIRHIEMPATPERMWNAMQSV